MIKKFIIRTLILSVIFVLIFSGYIYLGTKALEYRNGPGISAILTRQFENSISKKYECYVLGNSRTFRGIDPEKINEKTFNFSGNGEAYDLMYYKLKYILTHNGNFKTLILGTDFFQFGFNSIDNSWNYGDYFGEEFSKEYPSENKFVSKLSFIMGPLQGVNNTLGIFNSIKIFALKEPVKANRLKDDGQYLQEQRLSSDNLVERIENKLPQEVSFFEKILELCKKNNVKVLITLLPAQKEELSLYNNPNIKAEFDSFIQKYEGNNVAYLDFFNLNTFSSEDWLDVNHFTPKGADKFSIYLNSKMMEIKDQK